MTIEHISDTARWVAEYRAMETDRPDAIFRDPYARRLAGAKGALIADTVPRGRQMAWAMITRTAVFDEIIMERVRGGVDLVVNLAAGLDARPWRMDLPASLRWVDVDLPGILGHKVKELANEKPRCQYEAVMQDLSDAKGRDALFARLGASCKNALIITEGLIIYLEPAQVADLSAALNKQPSFRWWLTDLASPRLLKLVERSWGKALERGNAPFKFAPAEGSAFFAPQGWRELQFRASGEESRRLKRDMQGAWIWRLIVKFFPRRIREEWRRIAGYLLLERA